jgi:hypothetical protein
MVFKSRALAQKYGKIRGFYGIYGKLPKFDCKNKG